MAQLIVKRIIDVNLYARKNLFGKGVLVESVNYIGGGHCVASFEDSSLTLGMKQGIILSTGLAFEVTGPNNSETSGKSIGTPGDKQLKRLVNHDTYDAAVIELKITPQHEFLSFNYVFASEEYKEYVDKSFNDVFGLFIEGPGLTRTNLAKVPNSDIPIAIDHVNHKRNTNYYVDNETYDHRNLLSEKSGSAIKYESGNSKYAIQFDGFTKLLQAIAKVTPGKSYRIKIAIADVGDRVLDSGVFLEAHSFNSHKDPEFKFGLLADPQYYEPPPKIVLTHEASDAPLVTDDSSLNNLKRSDTQHLKNTANFHNTKHNYIIYFDFDKTNLYPKSRATLDSLVDIMNTNKELNVEIIGHTDYLGSEAYNSLLGQKRAKQAYNYILNMGISKDRLSTTSKGELKPKTSSNSFEGRALNRRVEFRIYAKNQKLTEWVD